MNQLNTISVGIKEIWAHKFRSALLHARHHPRSLNLVGMSALVKGMENKHEGGHSLP